VLLQAANLAIRAIARRTEGKVKFPPKILESLLPG